jgi:hypothetical protein
MSSLVPIAAGLLLVARERYAIKHSLRTQDVTNSLTDQDP